MEQQVRQQEEMTTTLRKRTNKQQVIKKTVIMIATILAWGAILYGGMLWQQTKSLRRQRKSKTN